MSEENRTGELSMLVISSLERMREDIAGLRETIESVVPGGDIEGHRRYHEALIAAQLKRAKMFDAIIEKSIVSLVWAGVVAVATAVWHHYFRGGVK